MPYNDKLVAENQCYHSQDRTRQGHHPTVGGNNRKTSWEENDSIRSLDGVNTCRGQRLTDTANMASLPPKKRGARLCNLFERDSEYSAVLQAIKTG